MTSNVRKNLWSISGWLHPWTQDPQMLIVHTTWQQWIPQHCVGGIESVAQWLNTCFACLKKVPTSILDMLRYIWKRSVPKKTPESHCLLVQTTVTDQWSGSGIQATSYVQPAWQVSKTHEKVYMEQHMDLVFFEWESAKDLWCFRNVCFIYKYTSSCSRQTTKPSERPADLQSHITPFKDWCH